MARTAPRLALGALLLVGSWALANDHRGSLGLTAATGGEFVTGVGVGTLDRGFRLPIEIGGTLGLFDNTELRLAGRLAPPLAGTTGWGGSIHAGIRNSHGRDNWLTFFDLELAVHVAPLIAVGPRAAFGVQYDFLPIMGAYAQIGAQLGGATALRLSFELTVGLQFRTYLFE